MQYLLTEDEYREMSDRPARACLNKAMDERQALCIKLAMATRGYCLAVPGTCRGLEYCDDCPSADFCQSDLRDWSK